MGEVSCCRHASPRLAQEVERGYKGTESTKSHWHQTWAEKVRSVPMSVAYWHLNSLCRSKRWKAKEYRAGAEAVRAGEEGGGGGELGGWSGWRPDLGRPSAGSDRAHPPLPAPPHPHHRLLRRRQRERGEREERRERAGQGSEPRTSQRSQRRRSLWLGARGSGGGVVVGGGGGGGAEALGPRHHPPLPLAASTPGWVLCRSSKGTPMLPCSALPCSAPTLARTRLFPRAKLL